MSGSKQPVLAVRDLVFHYPDGRLALDGVSFEIDAGECVAVVGPNGAGKSTLLLHLNGILPGRPQYPHEHHPGDGHAHPHAHSRHPSVWVAGMPVANPHLPEIRRRVGLLFQDPDDQLFCPTVEEDVTFGPRNLGRTRSEALTTARRCLAAVGLDGYESRLPHHLSFGERKRVCLAGVLACEPELLVLDEPTSNLDPRARRQFIRILRSLPAAKLIASHDLEMVLELCSRVILLDHGRVQGDGAARAILSDEPLLERHGLELPLSIELGMERRA